jgi:murein hydrolase activator
MKPFVLIIGVFVCIFNENLFSQNRADLEKRRNNTLKEIAETENILSTIKQSKTESLEKLNLLDKKISLRNTLIVNLSSEISQVEKKTQELEKTTQSLGSNIKEIKEEYGRMIYLSYLNRSNTNELMFLLSSSSINQAYKRLKYLQQYSESRKRQVAIISSFQNTLNSQIQELENTRKEKGRLLSAQEKENNVMKTELEEKSKTVNTLKLKENELNKKLKEKSKIAERLASEIERIIKTEIKAKATAVKTSSKHIIAEDNNLSNNFRDNRGKLPWPIDRGVITRNFGKYRHPIYKNVEQESLGIDISTVSDATVQAIFDGQVTDVVPIKGSNFVVVINHGRFYTVYQNLVDVNVRRGDKVKTKQPIGKVFTDSESKSAILHLQIWDEWKVQDPEIWLTHN